MINENSFVESNMLFFEQLKLRYEAMYKLPKESNCTCISHDLIIEEKIKTQVPPSLHNLIETVIQYLCYENGWEHTQFVNIYDVVNLIITNPEKVRSPLSCRSENNTMMNEINLNELERSGLAKRTEYTRRSMYEHSMSIYNNKTSQLSIDMLLNILNQSTECVIEPTDLKISPKLYTPRN